MGKELSEMTLEELWELFPIILKEHNKDYKEWYEIEKQNLLECINKKNILRINHIGSSAVEGLISKPTIDILMEIDSETNIEQLTDTLVHNGWILMSSEKSPQMQMSFNKGYTKEGFAEKVYHLHIRFYDNWNELYFRDYLIDHKEVASEYGKLKLELMDKYKHNRDGYTHAKTDFILKYTEKAKEEYGDKYKPKNKVRLTNVCPVFICKDVRKTVNFYVEKLGFKFATHYDKIDNFATIYRDDIEFVIVQSKFGEVESNTKRYGNGYDAYIDTDTVKGVDIIYDEFKSKGVKILCKPNKTSYGSYEFVIEDIDGRLIGIGLIYSNEIYFENSNIEI